MQAINERVAKVESRVDSLEERATVHGRELDEMRIKNAKQDSKLDKICRETKDNTELSRSIKGGIKTIQWMFYAATGVLGLYLTLKQLGWM